MARPKKVIINPADEVQVTQEDIDAGLVEYRDEIAVEGIETEIPASKVAGNKTVIKVLGESDRAGFVKVIVEA